MLLDFSSIYMYHEKVAKQCSKDLKGLRSGCRARNKVTGSCLMAAAGTGSSNGPRGARASHAACGIRRNVWLDQPSNAIRRVALHSLRTSHPDPIGLDHASEILAAQKSIPADLRATRGDVLTFGKPTCMSATAASLLPG